MTKAAVLVSEGGAKLQALIDCVYFNEIPDFDLTVISSDPKAYALTRAKNAGLPCYVVEEAIFPNGASFALALLNKLRDLDTDLIILSDFFPAIGEGTARLFSGRVIGVRPALAPAFEGVCDSDVCAAAVLRGIKITGATAYYADDSGGVGPIILQKAVEVLPDDTPGSLRRRVMEEAEWRLLPEAVKLHCQGRLRIEEGRVTLTD
jgi:phosphoribosylglycinamide formyltransferase-1